MNDKWSEIVFTLLPHFENNSSEDVYQKDVESCLQILGWKRFNKSMQVQSTLPIGNSNSIRLDILLRKNDVNVLPIEIKRPSNICNVRQEFQLLSYMRMLRVNVGLYVGEDFRLYYDNPEDSSEAICVFSSKINESCKNGEKLCALLDYSTFDKTKLELFCRDEYDKIQAKMNIQTRINEFLAPEYCSENILSLIKLKFLDEGFEDYAIDEVLNKLHVYVQSKSMTDSRVLLPEPIVKKNVDNAILVQSKERKPYVRTANKSFLEICFDDGTIISHDSAIEVERLFILKVGLEKVKSLGLQQCRENLIGTPATTSNPKYLSRWTYLDRGWYLFNCSNNGDKKKHIERIIDAFKIKAKVKILV